MNSKNAICAGDLNLCAASMSAPIETVVVGGRASNKSVECSLMATAPTSFILGSAGFPKLQKRCLLLLHDFQFPERISVYLNKMQAYPSKAGPTKARQDLCKCSCRFCRKHWEQQKPAPQPRFGHLLRAAVGFQITVLCLIHTAKLFSGTSFGPRAASKVKPSKSGSSSLRCKWITGLDKAIECC